MRYMGLFAASADSLCRRAPHLDVSPFLARFEKFTDFDHSSGSALQTGEEGFFAMKVRRNRIERLGVDQRNLWITCSRIYLFLFKG